METSQRKKQLRRLIKSRLELLRPAEGSFLQERLRDRVMRTVLRFPGLWGIYRPMPGEADPTVPMAELGGDIEWCYPRIVGDKMEFARGDLFETTPLGFEQPIFSEPAVPLADMVGVLVPGLAFDGQGGRLGRGRGYYDRALAGYQGMKVGIAFSCQILEGIPLEAWDLKMDAIITETSVIRCGGVFK